MAQLRRLGAFAWISVLAMVASQVCFVVAIKSGSTAEVFFFDGWACPGFVES